MKQLQNYLQLDCVCNSQTILCFCQGWFLWICAEGGSSCCGYKISVHPCGVLGIFIACALQIVTCDINKISGEKCGGFHLQSPVLYLWKFIYILTVSRTISNFILIWIWPDLDYVQRNTSSLKALSLKFFLFISQNFSCIENLIQVVGGKVTRNRLD